MRRSVVLFTIVMLICMNFSGCNGFSKKPSYLKIQSSEIIRCFDEKDVDGLKSLFCTNTQNYYDLDTEIKEAFELYEGKSESYNINSEGGWSGGFDDGVWVDKHNSPEIEHIKTSENKEYFIGFCIYEIYKYDDGMVGISGIALRDDNENELAVIGGFGWDK